MNNRGALVMGLLVLFVPTGQAAEQAKKADLPPPDGVTWQHGLSSDGDGSAKKADSQLIWQHGLSGFDEPVKPAAIAPSAPPPAAPVAASAQQRNPVEAKKAQPAGRALKSLEKSDSVPDQQTPPAPEAPPATSQAVSGTAPSSHSEALRTKP